MNEDLILFYCEGFVRDFPSNTSIEEHACFRSMYKQDRKVVFFPLAELENLHCCIARLALMLNIVFDFKSRGCK